MMLAALRWAVFGLVAFAINFPVLVTLVTSFKTPREIATNPTFWIEAPTLANYGSVLTVTDRLNLFAYLWNSLAAALIGAGLAVLLALPAAYAIARGAWGRRAVFPLVVNLRAVPLIIFAIPIYMGFQWLGLLDTRLGLGLILTIVNLPLALVILVNAISDLPEELDEAARIDGAGALTILVRIVAPLVRPALATAFIFGFITAWNEFLFGLMLTTRNAVPVTVGSSFFFATAGGGVQWGLAAAVMILAALPPMLLGLLMYRAISRSMLGGALKG
jgi:multiple sugar transport system permease protein